MSEARTIPVVASTNIDGTITSEGIQSEVLMYVERKAPWSMTEIKHYATYNIVTKQIIKEYTVPSFTTFALALPFVVALSFSFSGILFCSANMRACM